MGSVPRYYYQRDCNELMLFYAPSHRPNKGALDENLPRNSSFFIHGLYPSYHRHEVKEDNDQVSLCGKIHHIQTTSKYDIEIDYNGPDEVVKKEFKKYWRAINCNISDEGLWEHEWNRHGKYNNFSNREDYWMLTLEAAKPFLDEESPKNLGNFLRQQGYISGQEYNCLALRHKLDQLVGHKVNVCFDHGSGHLYLVEVCILFDNSMGRIIDNEQSKIDNNAKFLFEDWCGRFNLPRDEGGQTNATGRKNRKKVSRKLRQVSFFLNSIFLKLTSFFPLLIGEFGRFNMCGRFNLWAKMLRRKGRRQGRDK